MTFRDGCDGAPMTSRFVLRVRAAHRWHKGLAEEPREEWLIAEWPAGRDEPTDYWISNLPADTTPNDSRAWRGCAGRSSWCWERLASTPSYSGSEVSARHH